MGMIQVPVDDRLERPSATSGGRTHSPLASLSQGALHRSADQITSGFEMSVEAAVRQAGFLHQLRYSDTVDAITAHSGRRNVDDSIVARRLVSLRTTHEWNLRPMRRQFDADDYRRHPVEANVSIAVVAGRRPMSLGNLPALLSPNLGPRPAFDEY